MTGAAWSWNQIKKLGGEGILSRQDVVDFSNQRNRVLWLMLDGQWHTTGQILRTAKGREGLRRMRELREIPNVSIERAKHPTVKRDFIYKLNYKPGIQRELF